MSSQVHTLTKIMEVVRHYGPAYLTAVGTMSSAATLAVALQCAGKAKPLRKDMVQFGVPLFANIHLCGSVLTEVFFCMTISRCSNGSIPSPEPWSVLPASWNLRSGRSWCSWRYCYGITRYHHRCPWFQRNRNSSMLTIFALQDSFGTACNVTGDGALT